MDIIQQRHYSKFWTFASFKKQDCFASRLSDTERCVSVIKVYMNDDKTEFIASISKHNANAFIEQSVQLVVVQK